MSEKKLFEVTIETSFYVYADKAPDENSSYIQDTISDLVRDRCYSVDARQTKSNGIGSEPDEAVCVPRGEPKLTVAEALELVNRKVDTSQMTLAEIICTTDPITTGPLPPVDRILSYTPPEDAPTGPTFDCFGTKPKDPEKDG